MPSFIGAAVSIFASSAAGLAFSVGAGVALTNAILFGATIGAYAALSVGLTALTRAFTPKPEQPKPEDVQQSFRQGVQPRVRHYGRVKVSGPWMFGGTHEGAFHKVIALGHGAIAGIEEYWIDDARVSLDGALRVRTAPYGGDVQIEVKLGTDDQTAFSGLVSAFGEYTSNHRGRGITMLYARQDPVAQEDYFEKFPQGIDTLYRCVLRGAKVKNPKTDAIAWSDNAAAVIRDYMTHADGMRLPESLLTTPQARQRWEDAFDACDENVPIAGGGTEKRYRLWGSHTLVERPGDVIARMLACCDGAIVPTADGGVTLKIGAWSEPSVTLTEDDILDITELTSGIDREQRPNTIRAQFLDAGSDYSSADADPWTDPVDVTARGTEADDISLIMAPAHGQARRLMKLRWFRTNPDWVGRFSVHKKGLALIGEQFVRIRLAEFGIDDVFEIQSLALNFVAGGEVEGVTIDVIALPQRAYAWNAGLEEGTAPAATASSQTSTVPVPTGVVVTIDRVTVGSQEQPVARVSFDPPTVPALRVEARFKATADSNWNAFTVASGATKAQSPTLSDGTEYEFQVRHLTLTGRASDWSASITITPVADDTAPNPVTAVSAVGGSSTVALSWTTPNNANFSRTVIRRHTADDEGASTKITGSPVYGPASTAMTLDDTGLTPGTYYYWISAANASGVESASVVTGAPVV